MAAQKNCIVVYSISTNQLTMVIVDCNNPADPCFNPVGCAQLPIDIVEYNSMNPDEFQAYLTKLLPPMPSPSPRGS